MIRNLHSRRLPAPEAEVGALIDTLAGERDELWPGEHWPPIMLDRPLGRDATGGHGPVRYHVESHVPGRTVRFRFSAPRGFDGFHEFSTVNLGPAETELRHLMVVSLRFPSRITGPLIWIPLHDALLEDCLDRAERAITGAVREPARWSRYVRLLRSSLTTARLFRPRTGTARSARRPGAGPA